MEIIYQKDENTSMADFFEEALTNDIIKGVFLSTTITKDDIVVIVDPTFYEEKVGINYTLEELEKMSKYNVLPLTEALKLMSNTGKKVVLNILPIYLLDVTEENLEEKTTNAARYITILRDYLLQFPTLNVYICTPVQRTLYLLNEIINDRKLGLIVTLFNLTYVDIDFYVIDISMVNMGIITQELSRRKEIMIATITRKDIQIAKELFGGKQNGIIVQQLQFITNYPDDLYKALTTSS